MVRVGLYQVEDRGSLEENVSAVVDCIKRVENLDFLCVPEFFAHPLGFLRDLTEKFGKKAVEKAYERTWWVIDEVREASKSFDGCLIAGTVIEKSNSKYYNTCYILRRGEVVAKYRKINIIQEEVEAGIAPGSDVVSFRSKGVDVGVMVCADCLSDKVVDSICSKAKLVFLPISMTSPDHPSVEGHPLSLKAARKYGVVIAKTSRTAVYRGKKFGVKSAVITPQGVLAEAMSVDEQLLIASVRLDPDQSKRDSQS